MKKSLSLFLLLACIANSGCEKCKNITHIDFANITKEYFGSYKPGSYWIYLNRDSSAMDSVWINNYHRWTEADRLQSCISTDRIRFDIQSTYLHYDPVNISIATNGPEDAITNFFTSGVFKGIIMRDDSLSFYNSIGTYPIINNYSLWSDPLSQLLKKVIIVDNIVYAPDLGIVQYVPSTGKHLNDTFSLVRHYFP